jgi:hypothetical protein
MHGRTYWASGLERTHEGGDVVRAERQPQEFFLTSVVAWKQYMTSSHDCTEVVYEP